MMARTLSKWQITRLWSGDSATPWRAWAPEGACGEGPCMCKSYRTWAEAMAYVGGYLSAET